MEKKKHGPFTILDRTTKRYDTPLEELREDAVLKPGGERGSYVTVKLTDGVLALAVDDEGTAYFTRQFRYAMGVDSIEPAAGIVEEGEEPLDTAKRELEEELGITARSWTDLGRAYPCPSLVEMQEQFFLARDLEFGPTRRESSEAMETVKMPFAEAVAMAVDGRVVATGACLAILRAARLLGV